MTQLQAIVRDVYALALELVVDELSGCAESRERHEEKDCRKGNGDARPYQDVASHGMAIEPCVVA